jgi:EAL domain-containing protein (putative c-di-GMP-specific phosphodiesterase class I)
MNDQIQTRRQMESDLRGALKTSEFPALPAALHRRRQAHRLGRGAGALQHPTKGLLGPDVFIGLAEQTDLIVALGRWVLREACETALEWPSDILLSVNLSPAQFALSDVVEDVREALIQTRFPASRLELEITENVMLVDTDGALATMNALKQLGVRLNMDDFGTGYSSSATCAPTRSTGSRSTSASSPRSATAPTIAPWSRRSSAWVKPCLTVTAEGVETEEQLAILGKDQCNEVQGYFMSRPIDKAAFARLLQTARTGPADHSPSKKGRVI